MARERRPPTMRMKVAQKVISETTAAGKNGAWYYILPIFRLELTLPFSTGPAILSGGL
jgi:hypothetical protein